MYFWNLSALKKDLIEKKLSEHDVFKYFFANVVALGTLSYVFMDPSMTSVLGGYDTNAIDLYINISTGITTILGTWYVYHCNGEKYGKDFFYTFFPVSFVWGVRYAVIIFIPLLVILSVYNDLTKNVDFVTTWFDYGIFVGADILYYVLLNKHMQSITETT